MQSYLVLVKVAVMFRQVWQDQNLHPDVCKSWYPGRDRQCQQGTSCEHSLCTAVTYQALNIKTRPVPMSDRRAELGTTTHRTAESVFAGRFV